MKNGNVTAAQKRILSVLDGRKGKAVEDIARDAFSSTGPTIRVCRKLAERGYAQAISRGSGHLYRRTAAGTKALAG